MKKNLVVIFTLLFLAVLTMFCSCFGNLTAANMINLKNDFSVEDTLDEVSAKKAHVILLFGQSNASGISSNSYIKPNIPMITKLYPKKYKKFTSIL